MITYPVENDDTKVDVLVRNRVLASNTDPFGFHLERYTDNIDQRETVSGTLTADIVPVNVIEFNVDGLPAQNTDNPYITYKYTYELIECDENGQQLTDTETHTFTADGLHGENSVTIQAGTTAPEYLYYKVLTGVEMEAKKVITMTEGKEVKNDQGEVTGYEYEHSLGDDLQCNGVLFEDIPVYSSAGGVINYKVSETPIESMNDLYEGLTSDEKKAKEATINDYQIYDLYNIVANDEEHYQTNGPVADEIKDQSGSYFSFVENADHYYRHYGYQGTSQAYRKVKKTNSTGTGARAEGDTPASGHSSHFNLLNTLPLTAVDVVKTWDDQSDKFNLRPYDIASKLHLKTTKVSADELTANDNLGDDALAAKTWTELNKSLGEYQQKADAFPSRSGNTYTYTYQKILKYAYENVPYLFSIEENKINAYNDPIYEKQYLDLTELDKDNYATDGTVSLTEKLKVKNKLIVKKITVSKAWDDTSNCTGDTDDEKKCKDAENNALHYAISPNLTANYKGYKKDANGYVLNSGYASPTDVSYSQTETIAKDGDPVDYEDLPVYDADGTAINWSVAETTQKYGYVKTYDPSQPIQLLNGTEPDDRAVAIKNTLPITQVTVTKIWADQNNLFGIRPSSINLTLYRTTKSDLAHDADENADETQGWVKVEEATVTGSSTVDTWTYIFNNLLQYNVDNQPYYFKVEEDAVNGYTTTYNRAVDQKTLGVTNTMQTIEVIAAKEWNDNGYSGSDFSHYNVQVTLSSSNFALPLSGYTLSKVIGSDVNDGSGVKFTNLPRYKADGTEIIYNITENATDDSATAADDATGEPGQLSGAYHSAGDTITAVATETIKNTFNVGSCRYGYEGTCKLEKDSSNGNLQFNIRNTLPVISFTAEKKWDDENNRDFVRPDSVTFTLKRRTGTNDFSEVAYANAVQTTWKVNFGKQLKYDSSNAPYAYTIDESDVSSYTLISKTPTEAGNDSADYVFTNKHTAAEKKLKVQKIWNDSGYKDTIRPDLSNVSVELWCRYQKEDENGALISDRFEEHRVSADSSIMAHNGGTAYVDTHNIDDFTEVDDYTYTYEFEHLPVYVNLSGTSTNKGTQRQAITYYIKESFASNGHVYTKEYSATNTADSYVGEPSVTTGTTLESGTEENPDTIYVKNTPVTRDIIVTKDWNDNYYGKTESAGEDTTSDLSKLLHYDYTKITLTGTSVLAENAEPTTVYSEQTMYLPKANTDPTDTTNYKGVIFRDVPIYDKNGNVISYKVTEAKSATDTASELATPENDTLNTVVDGEFEQKTGAGEYSYGYVGSAKKAVKTSDSRTYVTRFHITDTLPLTAVDVEKTWNDQSNAFGLRPNDIADKLTLSRSAVSGTVSDFTTVTFTGLISTEDNRQYVTESATYPAKSGNTYTYKKILKYDESNNPYIFKIEETPITAYMDPNYVKQYLNYSEVARENTASNGMTALSEKLQIKNTLDTRDIKVYKNWIDRGNTYTRYKLNITLSSEASNTENGRSEGGKYKEVKTIDSTDDNQCVTFEGLPKYDIDGNVIVYNVREDSNSGTSGTVENPVSIESGYTGSQTLTGTLPKFTDGYRHYGYKGSAEYYAVTEDGKTYVEAYYITNTLPQTSIKAAKTWEDISQYFKYQGTYTENGEEKNYQSISVRLTRTPEDSTPFNEVKAVAYYASSMETTFTSLPVFNYNNEQYTYKVEEVPLKGYTAKYTYSTLTGSDEPASVPAIADATAKVTINNTPITGNADVVKVDQTNYDAYNIHGSDYTDHVLPNAEFELTCGDVPVKVKLVTDDGNDYYTLDSSGTSTVISGSDGYIRFRDFPLNTYKLTETNQLSGYLKRTTPSVFTIDVQSAESDNADKVTYDSGFIYSEDSVHRIGNLQHVEETKVSLVKVDEDDESVRLKNATYYLLQMRPYNSLSVYSPGDYVAAADKAIEDCKFELADENGNLKDSVLMFWHTSDMVNGGHIPYVYTTNENGEIKAPLLTLAKPVGDTSRVYASNGGRYNIIANDSGINSFIISNLERTDSEGNDYQFNLIDLQNDAGTAILKSDVTCTLGENGLTITYANAAAEGLHFTLVRSIDGTNWTTVPESYGEGPITGLMNGRYVLVEVQSPVGYERSYCDFENGSPIGAFEISSDNKVVSVKHKDPRKSASLDILKENEYGDPLNGGIFDLYYQPEANKAKYYTLNSTVAPPAMTYALTGPEPSTPDPQTGQTTYTYDYQYTYTTLTDPPTETEHKWILPRTDNDYIYFVDNDNWRSYQINNPASYIYDNENSSSARMTKGDLFIERDNIYADFYDFNGKWMERCLVWERFVYYTDDNGSYKVVWKVQPPDGAQKVEFHQGEQSYTNRTSGFTFIKGKMYGNNGNISTLTSSGTHYVADGDWIDKNYTGTKEAGYSGVAYEPTAQKLIFRRNSEYCWDNLHVEFFRSTSTENTIDINQATPIGETFPGYLMEPYGYADNAYHIQFPSVNNLWGGLDYAEKYTLDGVKKYGNLTYEITIPKGATHFRINNGTTNTVSGTYSGFGSYKTAITKLSTDTNKKNYNNYWKLAPSGSGSDYGYSDAKDNVGLKHWSDDDIRHVGDHINETFGSFPVDSDSDFVYFKKPSSWKNHVYAYFYAGGNLRSDNYQRAVYSIWPGVIPYGSEVSAPNPTDNYANFAVGIGNMTLVPGSTFKDARGDTYYRFRLPLGDRTNYQYVLFSDGMVGSGDGTQTGHYHGDGIYGHETNSKVECKSGYAYDKNSNNWQFADHITATETYLFRQKNDSNATTTDPENADYLYIRNNNSDLWDDIHITFYNAGGGAILQSGTGYVMKYAGTKDGYQYFRIPIPSNAAKFAINNGNNKNDGRSTGIYPILRHGTENSATTTVSYQVYGIKSRTALELLSPHEEVTVTTTVVTGPDAISEGIDYTIRTHQNSSNQTVNGCVWIENTANWDETQFYGINFLFYDAGGERITSDSKTYPAFKRNNLNDHNWICKEIPINAASFSITMEDTTRHYDIYPQAVSGTTQTFTSGDMIYQTQSDNSTLALSWPAANVHYTSGSAPSNDDFGDHARGDYLYLVDTANDSSWDSMRVVFYQEDGTTAIDNTSSETEISAARLGKLTQASGTAISGETTTLPEAAGTWYRIAIPEDAASFKLYDNTVSSETKHSDKAYPIYPLRSSYSSRRKDYTLGHMQYSIPSAGDNGAYALSLIYPIFTETEEATNPYSEGPQEETFGQTADSINKANGAPLTRYTDVEPYASLPVAETPSFTGNTPADMPVLYATNSDTITYSWTEGEDSTIPANNYIWFDNSHQNWENVYAYFYEGTGTALSWTGEPMTYDTDKHLYKALVPGDYTHVIFNRGDDVGQIDVTLDAAHYYGRSCVYTPAYTETGSTSWSTGNYIYFKKPTHGYTDATSQSWHDSVAKLTKTGSSSEVYSVDSISGNKLRKQGTTSTLSGNYWRFEVSSTAGWTDVQFYDRNHTSGMSQDGNNYPNGYTSTNTFATSSMYVLTKDPDYKSGYNEMSGPTAVEEYSATETPHSAVLSDPEVITTTATTYSVTYQPEDRYGYINSVTESSDATIENGSAVTTDGNFIKVVTGTLTDPYIKFYDASNAVIGGNGISLKNAKLNSTAISGDGTENNPYLIRLPKNAQSVQLFDGTTAVDDAKTLDNDGGAMLTVNGDSVTKTSTAKGNATIETPAYKTDFDYIYFTDTDNWKNTSDTNRIYAYYYGGVDGEYTAWPGVPAEGSYFDNNGKTVYRFQPPSDNNSYPYPYVIFNNGSSDTNPVRKITQKIEYQLGYNYTPNGSETAYGTVTFSAKATDTGFDKAHAETNNAIKLTYNKYSPDKYIYIVNNGTQNSTDTNNRFELDEMHVTFFDGDKNVIDTASPGYYADRIEYGDYQGKDVYKISVPQGAKSFRISNGQGKDSVSGQDKLRQSVIEPLSINGLYQFVVDSDASKIWNTNTTVGTGLNAHPYYLTLLNKREEAEEDDEPIITGSGDPVYMATVETGDNGLIKWITRLKEPTVDGKTYDKNDSETYISGTVDTEYLDHEASDIRNTGVTSVRVKKWGNYFWKEVIPPVGYEAGDKPLNITVNAEEADKTVNVITATNTRKRGKVQLTKTSEQALGEKDIGTPLEGASFKLYKDELEWSRVLKKSDEKVYYVPEEIEGKSEIVTVSDDVKYFEVTDTDMLKKLEEYELYDGIAGHFKLYDTVTTDSNGKLVIENLEWGEYYLVEETAPDGYSKYDTKLGGQPNKNKVSFSVGRNTCEFTQELTCTDEIKPAKLKIQKEINEYVPAWGTPTFIFKIKKLSTVDSKTTFERLVSLQVTDTDTLTNVKELDIEPGKYEVTELNVSRYALDSCTITPSSETETVTDISTADKKAVFTVKADGEVTVKFRNVVEYYDKFSHNVLKVNEFKGSKYLEVIDKVVPVVDDGKVLEKAEIYMTSLTAYLIGSDGKRAALENDQKKTLTFETVNVTMPESISAQVMDGGGENAVSIGNLTSTENGSFSVSSSNAQGDGKYYVLLKDLPADGDYVIESVSGAKNVTVTESTPANGKKNVLVTAEKTDGNDPFNFRVCQEKYDARFEAALSFDAENGKITINDPSRFADGVYRLKATYKHNETANGVSGTFDLIMGGRNDQKLKQFEKTVIFHADADNLSYYAENGGITAQYAFTFSMIKNSSGYEVYNIRHNGLEVTWDDVDGIINNTNNDLKIIETHRPNTTRSGYAVDSKWIRSDDSLTYNASELLNIIKSLVIVESTTDPLIYTAQLVAAPQTPNP